MSEYVNPKTSVRQLDAGQMENIRKKFENTAEGTNPRPPISPKKIPRPVSSALSNSSNVSPKRTLPKPALTSQNGSNEKEELKSTREQILHKRRPSSESPAISKLVQNFNEGNAQSSGKLKTVHSDNDIASEALRRNPVSRFSPTRPVSVAERTKRFESIDNTEDTNVPGQSTVSSLRPTTIARTRSQRISSSLEGTEDDHNVFKRTPTAKPRSRPVSSEVDSKDMKPTPPVKPRSRPPSQAQDDGDNEYGAVWESGPSVPTPPPVKPPRTGAHDDYMKLKDLNIQDKQISQEKFKVKHHYETVPDDFIQNAPVYKKINKSENENKDSVSKRPLRPNRPPPPRDKPDTVATSTPQKSNSFCKREKPEIPKRPAGETLTGNVSPLYEELDLKNTKFDLSKIKHWDLPEDNLLEGSGSLKRSFSAECLRRDSFFDDPIYVDPIKVNFRDDTDFDVYVDPSGYAIPYRHKKRLQQTASTPAQPKKSKLYRQLSMEARPISQAVKCKLGNLRKRIFSQDTHHLTKDRKEFDISKNKKKLQSVKMKINIAFAIMRKAKKTENEDQEGTQSADLGSLESDSLVDEKEIEKRKDYCSVVRRNTAKKRKDNKQAQSVAYPQLFDFALIVGLEPVSEEGGYRPYIIYKFPEQIESNISIPQFCFPDALEFDVKTASPAAPSESFSFVLTTFDGQHVYGYCKRLVPIDTPAGLPEVICIVSPVDAFSMYNDLLDEIEAKRQLSLIMAKELIVAAFGRPLPEPGKMVHVRTLDENWETGTIFLARPDDDRVDNANRETLLSKLGVDKLIKLFSVMLLERSILFCAKNLGILSQTIHAMRSLLYPFSWPHTYIPVLPDTMLDICCSPTPYVIGILSSHLQTVLNLPLSEIFIFDLDKRQVIKSQGDEDTLLPKSVQKALKTVLNMCKVEGDLKNAQNLLISEAFLRFFVEAVGHYGNHITTQQNGQLVFEKDSFVKNAQSSSMEQFLEWFTETQMFEVFLTDKVETKNKSKTNTLNIFNSRIKEYNEELEEAKKDKKKSKGFLKLLK
ncbi:DENN domain-containing protein 2C-like isoform X2 [Mytilus californianus]|uniref:DENN domain-containing protein 2C-like isoform X2 n=1 Tax=Mytilus californianus TaxID=6549 RepID=UPI002247FE78|nr:DENN domain-containing protein 2C-like isoform X2 [Mytilus californianus]